MTFEYSLHIFEKYSNTNFHKDPFSRSRGVPCGPTYRRKDRQDEANGAFAQFSERAFNSVPYSYIFQKPAAQLN